MFDKFMKFKHKLIKLKKNLELLVRIIATLIHDQVHKKRDRMKAGVIKPSTMRKKLQQSYKLSLRYIINN